VVTRRGVRRVRFGGCAAFKSRWVFGREDGAGQQLDEIARLWRTLELAGSDGTFLIAIQEIELCFRRLACEEPKIK
jgi:hypothetical protein